jgi:hypothetical protein
MQIGTKEIVVLFEDTCVNCGTKQDGATAVPLVDLVVDVGTPLCQKCGEVLMLEDTCDITSLKKISLSTKGNLAFSRLFMVDYRMPAGHASMLKSDVLALLSNPDNLS